MSDSEVAPPAKRQKKKNRAIHKPINHVHDGTEPRSGTRCLLCKEEKLELRSGDDPVERPDCELHPQCGYWCPSGSNCGYCDAVSAAVSNAKARDNAKGMVSIMVHSYVNSNIGKSCYNCGYGPLTPQRQYRHSRQLSMNRLDNSKPHDNDPAQTVPTCLQCNMGQNDSTMAEFHERQVAMATYADQGYKMTDEQPAPEFPNHYIILSTQRLSFASYLIRTKQSNCRKDGIRLHFGRKDMEQQHMRQRGLCTLCGGLLYNDISFDQTVAGGGYRVGNFTLMHKHCNSFKGMWQIEEAYATARRHVVYWQ